MKRTVANTTWSTDARGARSSGTNALECIRNLASASFQLREVIAECDAKEGTGEEQEGVKPLGVSADPIASAGSDFQGKIDIAAGIIGPINPPGDAES